MCYLTIPETAAILRKSVVSLRCDITRNPSSLPPFSKVGGRILFGESGIYDYVKSKQVNHLSNESLSKSLQISGKKRGRPSSIQKSGA